jgi:hypothetical protein
MSESSLVKLGGILANDTRGEVQQSYLFPAHWRLPCLLAVPGSGCQKKWALGEDHKECFEPKFIDILETQSLEQRWHFHETRKTVWNPDSGMSTLMR